MPTKVHLQKAAVRGGGSLPLLVSFQSRTRSPMWESVLARTEEEVLSLSLHHLKGTWLLSSSTLFHTPKFGLSCLAALGLEMDVLELLTVYWQLSWWLVGCGSPWVWSKGEGCLTFCLVFWQVFGLLSWQTIFISPLLLPSTQASFSPRDYN